MLGCVSATPEPIAMRRLLALLPLISAPVLAQEADMLRLVCRPDQPAMAEPLAFSIDLGAKDAVETITGRRFGVVPMRDGIALFDPAQGPAAVVWRIDRVTGRFTRVDTRLRLEGICDKVERRF